MKAVTTGATTSAVVTTTAEDSKMSHATTGATTGAKTGAVVATTGAVVFILAALTPACSLVFGEDFEYAFPRVDAGVVSPGDGDAGASDCAASCASPPANACIDATTLRAHLVRADCTASACNYARYDILCAHGCVDGACVGDEPCNGVTCVDAETPTCLDGKTLRTRSASGTCAGGTCSYSQIDTTCASGCADGACIGEPCAGVTCNQPPAPSCRDANTRRGYEPTGTCSDGSCSYVAVDTSCASGCEAGACNNDPCAGVACNAPPAAACLNASTRRSYAATGTCNGGACSYTLTMSDSPPPRATTPEVLADAERGGGESTG